MFSLIKKKNYTKNTKSNEEKKYSLECLKPEERNGVVVGHRALNREHLGSIPYLIIEQDTLTLQSTG